MFGVEKLIKKKQCRQHNQNNMWRTIKAVLWSFLGVRSQEEFDQDKQSLNPLALLAVGFILCVVFVATLMIIVNIIV